MTVYCENNTLSLLFSSRHSLLYPLLWVGYQIYWIYCLDLFILSFFFSFFSLLILNNCFLKQRYLSWRCLHFSSIQTMHSDQCFFFSRCTSLKFIIRLNLDNFSCRYQLAFFWLMKIPYCNNFFVYYLLLFFPLN